MNTSHGYQYHSLGFWFELADLGSRYGLKSALVEYPHALNAQNNKGNSALMIASFCSHSDCVKILLEVGADPHLKNNLGETALMRAAMKGRLKCVELLIEAGVDLNETDLNGETALMKAASIEKGHDVVQYLVNKGADLNLVNQKGDSALLIACQNHCINTAKCLIESGADLTVVNHLGKTALSYAEEHENDEAMNNQTAPTLKRVPLV